MGTIAIRRDRARETADDARAGPGYMVRIFIREQGPSRKQQAASVKVFDMKITCGMIPYNLKRKE